MSKVYTQKSNSIRAAKKALEGQNPEGTTYELETVEGGFTFKLVLGETPVVEQAEAAAPVVDNKGIVIPPMPFNYLPASIDEIKKALQESVRTEERALIKRLIEDAGIPASEVRGMVEEVAMEHIIRIVNEDRQSWFHDFGKKAGVAKEAVILPPVAAAKPVAASEIDKPATSTKAKSQAPADRKKSSDIEGPTKAVWRIADAMLAKVGGKMENLKRKDVLSECDLQGIAFYTARTQYQRWFAAQKESVKN